MRSTCLVLSALSLAAFPAAAQPAAAPSDAVSCALSVPVAALGSRVILTAYTETAGATFDWTASAGTIHGRGATAEWELRGQGMETGPHSAALSAKLAGKEIGQCEVEIRVVKKLGEGGRGNRPTYRALLPARETEPAGYGLYSYLLLGSQPDEANKERYLKIIDACIKLIPALSDLNDQLPPKQLNALFLPTKTAAPEPVTAAWVLENYDYARATALISMLPVSSRTGIYIASRTQKLGAGSDNRLLLQNLSAVPARLVSTWVETFLNQAAQERFWEPRTIEALAGKLRLAIGVIAEGAPKIKEALAAWITFKS